VELPDVVDVVRYTETILMGGIEKAIMMMSQTGVTAQDIAVFASKYQVSYQVALIALVYAKEHNPEQIEIIRIQRTETKTGSDMWRCSTAEGRLVNVFRSDTDATRSFALFEAAGYGEMLMNMKVGDKIELWIGPIQATVRLVRGWWTVESVVPRMDIVQPDNVVTDVPF